MGKKRRKETKGNIEEERQWDEGGDREKEEKRQRDIGGDREM